MLPTPKVIFGPAFSGRCRRVTLILLALCLSLVSRAVFAAEPATAVTRDVTIPAGAVNLGATLYVPKGVTQPAPAVVLAHGSGPATRDELGFYIRTSLRMGLAVLAFDKRGTGQSTGVYEAFSVGNSDRIFRALASDLVFAKQWLAMQPEVDPERIGLLGGSQAGWIMIQAAAQEPVRFIVVGAGVPVSAGEEAVHGTYLQNMGGEGIEHDLRDTVLAELAAKESRGERGFDPGPVLSKIDTPTLWLFGLRDTVVPVLLSIDRLAELRKQGKLNNDVQVLPFCDHDFRDASTGARCPLDTIIVPWLRQIGVIR